MLMALKSADVNNHAPHISGRSIRRRKLTRRQRVKLAADLVSGEVHLDPALKHTCELLQVPAAEVRTELKTRAAARENGQRISTLIKAWDAASELEREAAIHSIGVAAVWDRLARVVA
jgi:hypothetical protein